MQKGISKERLIQSIALGANYVTILGLLLVIVQLQQNRALMRAQVRHELATTIVDLLNSSASNSQLASILRRAGRGEQLTGDEQFQFRLRSNALFRYWEDVHYQYRLGPYDEEEYSRQKARPYAPNRRNMKGSTRDAAKPRAVLLPGPPAVVEFRLVS